MATPSSPPSASVSEATTAQPQVDAGANNGGSTVEEKKPDLAQPLIFEDLYKADDIDKYKRYEADYTHRLMAKYFSEKTIYGADIYEEKVTVDGKIIKASRWPCTRSYADPVSSFNDLGGETSTSAAEIAASISNGKQTPKKTA